MPDIGVERHLRGLSEETKTALGTILDIEHADTDVTLPSMREIDDEETEFQTLKAERKLALADEQAKTKAARVSIRDEYGRSGATGKRKTAIARVTIWPGIGDMSCNKLHLDDAFPDIDHRGWMIKPFLVTNTMGLFDVKAIVTGGGKSGQAQAVRHGIAKALQLYGAYFPPNAFRLRDCPYSYHKGLLPLPIHDSLTVYSYTLRETDVFFLFHSEPAFRPSLKKAGMLTRDNRIVERKKPGLKKARKAFQWVKR